jgi:uncharacterized protein YPO0396
VEKDTPSPIVQAPSRTNAIWSHWTPISTVLTIAILALIAVIAFRVATGALTISLQSLHFNDLLTLILGFFSIWLSVSFYHEANKSNSRFYNDTYAFTKDISTILARVETGFGERLKNLAEDQSSIRSSVDVVRSRIEHTKAEVEEQESEVESTSEELRALWNEIIAQSTLPPPERDKLLAQIQEKDEQLAAARTRLDQATTALAQLDSLTTSYVDDYGTLRSFLRRQLREKRDVRNRLVNEKPAAARKIFTEFSAVFPERAIKQLQTAGWTDENNILTPTGLAAVRDLAQKIPASEQSL